MGEFILKTKIYPDTDLSNFIERNHLVSLLLKHSNKNLIAITAGAGYGKTTLVKEFLLKNSLNYGWYKLDEYDSNPYIFLSYFINAIKSKENRFGNASLELIDSIKSELSLKSNIKNILNTLTKTIINDFVTNVKNNFYIVLDDLHKLPKDEWCELLFNKIFENIPANLHFIITSREKLPFNTGYINSKRMLYSLDTAELKFNKEEITELSKNIYKHTPSETELKQIAKKSGGWITGMHMLFQSGNFNQLENVNFVNESVYNFFAEDIFASLEDRIKNFLLRTCLLENFTDKTCDFILNIKNSDRILSKLISCNVFISKDINFEKNKPVFHYNYQELFRDFLFNKLNESVNETERKKLFKKTSEYYLLTNDFINTINFCLLSGDFKNSTDLILKNIQSVISEGNISYAEKWLEKLPTEIIEKNAYLLYYKGNIEKTVYGNSAKAIEYYIKALDIKTKDEKITVKATSQIAEININKGKNDEAEKILKPLLKKTRLKESKAHLLYWIAAVHYSKSDYNEALKIFLESLSISNEIDLKTLKTDIMNSLGNIYLIQGNFTKSLFYYENVLNFTNNIFHKFTTLTNIIQLYSHSGKYSEAYKALNDAKEMENLYPANFFKINYLLASSHFYVLLGDYTKTIEIMKEFLALAREKNIPYYIYLSYLNLGYCYLYSFNTQKAEQYISLASEFKRDLSDTENIDLELSEAILKKENGISNDVFNKIENAYKHFSDNNLVYNKVQAGLQLAECYYKKANFEKSKKFLEESLSTASENEYYSLIQNELFYKREIYDFAIESGIQTEFIKEVFYNTAELLNSNWISEEYRNTLSERINTFYDINIECFGELKIKIRGKEIPDEKWIRKTRKLIFAYIVLNQKKNITKDVITGLFYPESSQENADNIFHQTISNIRSIFTVEQKASNNTLKLQYISYADKIIKLNQDYFYYVDVYEFEKLYKQSGSFGLKEEDKIKIIEKAVYLYKGDFLPGYYQTWCEDFREKFRDMFIQLLKIAINIFENRKDLFSLEKYLNLLISYEPYETDYYYNYIESVTNNRGIVKGKMKLKELLKVYNKESGEELPQSIMNKILKLLS